MSDFGPRAVQFGNLEGGESTSSPHGIEFVQSVSLTLQAELGRTSMTVKEIVRLQIGSVIKLDKEAGEPIEILVNRKALANGKVVAIDSKYGIQITEILK